MNMDKKEFDIYATSLKDFVKEVLQIDYYPKFENTHKVPQSTLNLLKPPRKYPNPEYVSLVMEIEKSGFHEVKEIIDESHDLLFNSKSCDKEECLFKFQRLWERLNKLEEKLISDKSDKEIIEIFNHDLNAERTKYNIDGINKKLKNIQTNLISKPLDSCRNCQIYLSLRRVINLQDIMEVKLLEPTIEVSTSGLFLPNGNRTFKYPKSSVLILDSLKDGEFELTFVHEHTHTLLHQYFENLISKNKGLNEGFAVAMEYYYVRWKKSLGINGLEFNGNRYGEYLGHQILTLPDYHTIMKDLFDLLTLKKI